MDLMRDYRYYDCFILLTLMMNQLFKKAVGICLFQLGPDDMPYSPSVLVFALVINMLLTISQLAMQKSLPDSLFQGTLLIMITVFYCYLVLMLRNRSARFVQTCIALLLTSFLISLLLMPIIFVSPLLKPAVMSMALLQFFSALIIMWILVCQIWSIGVFSHIFSKAMDIHFFAGLVITFGMVGVELLIIKKL